jgi:hypothetical protein
MAKVELKRCSAMFVALLHGLENARAAVEAVALEAAAVEPRRRVRLNEGREG